MQAGAIALTALVTVLLLLVEHWLPWQMFLRRELPRLAAYILGSLAIAVPLSVLFACEASWYELAALWIVIVAGGLAVMLAYLVDWIFRMARLADDLAEVQQYREGVEDAQNSDRATDL